MQGWLFYCLSIIPYGNLICKWFFEEFTISSHAEKSSGIKTDKNFFFGRNGIDFLFFPVYNVKKAFFYAKQSKQFVWKGENEMIEKLPLPGGISEGA